MLWKILLTAVVSLSLGCSTAHLRVYFLDPDQGLIRKQKNEILLFEKAKGYLCMSPSDFQLTLQECAGSDPVVGSMTMTQVVNEDPSIIRVYFLEPTEGLVRRQSHELIPFALARGHLCMNPSDFEEMLADCS